MPKTDGTHRVYLRDDAVDVCDSEVLPGGHQDSRALGERRYNPIDLVIVSFPQWSPLRATGVSPVPCLGQVLDELGGVAECTHTHRVKGLLLVVLAGACPTPAD